MSNAISHTQQAKSSEKFFRPFTYEELDGCDVALSLFNYQRLCLALEIIERRLACDEPGCIDAKKDPELGEVHEALLLSVLCHDQCRNKVSICNQIQNAVSARFLSFLRGGVA